MSFYIGKTRIIISFYFIAIITLLLIFSESEFILLCLSGCIIHELGHLIAMCIYKSYPKEIKLCPFGMKILSQKISRLTLKKEVIIYLSGPLINLFTAFIFGLLNSYSIFISNLFLSIFNLLPLSATDGGSVLKIVFEMIFSDIMSKRLRQIIAFTIIFFIFVLSILQIVKSGYNFSLLIVAIYLLIEEIKAIEY